MPYIIQEAHKPSMNEPLLAPLSKVHLCSFPIPTTPERALNKAHTNSLLLSSIPFNPNFSAPASHGLSFPFSLSSYHLHTSCVRSSWTKLTLVSPLTPSHFLIYLWSILPLLPHLMLPLLLWTYSHTYTNMNDSAFPYHPECPCLSGTIMQEPPSVVSSAHSIYLFATLSSLLTIHTQFLQCPLPGSTWTELRLLSFTQLLGSAPPPSLDDSPCLFPAPRIT